ncbi:MAG: thymidylate synthase, partial [Thermotogaceae bacterium]|nr:thymidylate synthase [Thermotogaceae bacterium]
MANNVEYKVLDKGFIKLVEHMGNDLSAVQAARVSYGKGLSSDPQRDKKLIFYLMKHGHETPFEHIVFKFHVKAPLFVARQWFRHRIASYNEISGRYTQVEDDWYIPENIRIPDVVNKQGSVFATDREDEKEILNLIEESIKRSYSTYRELLNRGIAKELARIVLPLSMYTQWYWTVNARSLMNFLNLRADSHAQWEIRQYALKIAEIFKEVCPWTFEAFIKHRYSGDILKKEEENDETI